MGCHQAFPRGYSTFSRSRLEVPDRGAAALSVPSFAEHTVCDSLPRLCSRPGHRGADLRD